MTKLGQVILRNTRASQPAAGVEGRLYYVTDESVLERDSGSAWQSVSAGFTNPMTTAGDIIKGGASGTPQRLAIGSSGNVLTVSGGAPVWAAPATNGTVTSVGLTVPSEFSVSGSPITTSGTLAITKANQSANLVYAGPTSGAAAAPTFRAIVEADVLNALLTGTAGVILEHFMNSIPSGAGGLFAQNASGGYTILPTAPPTADALGVIAIASNAASGVALGSISTSQPGSFDTLCFGSVAVDLTWRFRLNAIPAVGQDFGVYIGFRDSNSATPIDGAYLFIDSSVANFQYRTRSNNVQTNVDSGLAAVADTWYKLRIQVDAAAANAIFTIDGGSSQTLTTNIPSGTSRVLSLQAYSIRISGTNNRILYLDYCRFAWSGGPA